MFAKICEQGCGAVAAAFSHGGMIDPFEAETTRIYKRPEQTPENLKASKRWL
jgi:hypothetical protein